MLKAKDLQEELVHLHLELHAVAVVKEPLPLHIDPDWWEAELRKDIAKILANPELYK